ncbi:rod shape-determining protein MreC [Profundibacterium mesophilum]|uniref:Cell shape-determining protein MreC n=1 Tax=Profundibacterium mesophilum KAUST100406-0324 TaxID=1037889 RepID=A0A921NXQ8_9RHOB|nr:rod shape-determining protein MreC [Profundibacterium mesophilum]KAF0676659.1 Cell shape-determining protein MreC [Profundibacterium mesophilum KAUST100406-0324]
MAREKRESDQFTRPVRRIVIGAMVMALIAIFLFWRIDSPRAERMRAAVIDRVVPSFDWALVPVTQIAGMIEDFQSYTRIYEQNQELRRELQQMKAWKEAALQLEQQNAKLLDLNKVRLDASLTYITGVVLADSGSPFRQSVLINIGGRDGIVDGWATTDGLGLVGRISGVGETSARVILLTDSNSRIPVAIQPSGQRAILAGDNSPLPPLDFVETPEAIRPGDRIVSSGDGGVFPAGLLVGQVVQGKGGQLRARLAADYERLEFLRVLRAHPGERIGDPGGLVIPPAQLEGPPPPPALPGTPSPDAQDAGDG